MGVEKSTFHQCMYGLEARDQHGVAPAYKPTSVLTNHSALAEVLQTRCDGNHRHAQLIGKHACAQAARYPSGLCAAIVKGIQVVKKHREILRETRDRLAYSLTAGGSAPAPGVCVNAAPGEGGTASEALVSSAGAAFALSAGKGAGAEGRTVLEGPSGWWPTASSFEAFSGSFSAVSSSAFAFPR